ncbi:CHAT domain-containing protein [Streptomyces sp. SP2-10]|uniref:CHAT domain-containing protein n=1 Tax=Streptomyces sp. SP2-10 TaxID=2873385 RepID=UPI001CA73637|nr:CHAT domain-containing protein [Streptomyces sp. SP2-10]MBY8840424.1 CHAT domain-containing protein [Streptomyces sp. SP2-10]
MIDTLLAALRSRLDALAEHGDAALLLNDQAVREARLLVAALPAEGDFEDTGPAVLEALLVVALVHWHRYCLRGGATEEVQEDEDRVAAVELFARIHRHDPLTVPDPLLPLVDTAGDVAEEGPGGWNGMAQPYLARYESTGDAADLRTAVQLLAAGLDATPEESPERPEIVLRLAGALMALHQDAGDEGVLASCIETMRAETRCAQTADHGAAAFSALSAALLVRFVEDREPGGLEESVRAAHRAVELAPQEAGADIAAYLGTVFSTVFDRTGHERLVPEALRFLREAVAHTPPGEPEFPLRLQALSEALLVQYRRTSDPAALQEAILAARRAFRELSGRDSADRARVVGVLAGGLVERWRRDGDRVDLSEAVHLWRWCLAALPADDSFRPTAAAEAGAVLWLLHQDVGDMEALEEAITYAQEAVESTPDGHGSRAGLMSNLAAMLRARFLSEGDYADLDRAIRLLRTAVARLPAGHTKRPALLSNLGNALRNHHDLTGDVSALAEAVAVSRAAVEATPHGHPSLPVHLGNLGAVLRARYESTGAAADLDETVALLRAAVAACAIGHPSRTVPLANLGNALRLRHEHTRDPYDAAEGRQALWAAAAPPAASPLVRLRAAWAYAEAARQDDDTAEALKGFELAVELLPRIAPPSVARNDREHRLGWYAGLGSEAAAAALDAGCPERALELLEQARGILLAEALTAHREMRELAAHDRVLHTRFQRLRNALMLPEVDADTRHSHGIRLEETITQIRALPGFSRFLCPPALAELQHAISDGPVVVVNVTDHRSDAIILNPEPRAHPRVVSLPGLTPNAVTTHVNSFLTETMPQTAAEMHRAPSQIMYTLAWLWDVVAAPVLRALDITGPPAESDPWPRVWWCPIGPLACLPLHAAGLHRNGNDSVLDRAISSYTPTLQALAVNRRRTHADAPGPAAQHTGALVVAVPESPGAPPLPHVRREADAVSLMMPQATLLVGLEARRDRVLAELDRYPVLHFACHGVTDWRDSSANRLMLSDGPLSVRDLISRRLDSTQLVVLSACSTATVGVRPSDEAVHLASSFLAAGAAHVVGTLWAVEDEAAARAATILYEHLTTGGSRPPHPGQAALALHATIRRLRQQRPGAPGLWAPFVHIGV